MAPAPMTTWVCSEVPEAMSEGQIGSGLVRSRHTGESPGGLELQQRVVACQELDESGYDTTLNHTINRRVLLLGQQPVLSVPFLYDTKQVSKRPTFGTSW
jgi:hypothetical protein